MTSKITQVQELTEVDRGGPDSITLRAHIDETFTIGPKVHGGTLQMVSGGLMITLLAPFFDGTPLPMVAAIALCGGLALIAALALAGARPRPCVAD